MKKHISLITGLLIILFSTTVTSFTNAQIAPNQTVTETQKANDTIVANQILTLWQNDSAYIGIGTVQDVNCKYEKFDQGETIFTYAEISVDVPLTDNLNSEQTILIKYLGGQVDDLCLTVNIEWECFPNDTVTPPSTFELSKGQSILFFVEETTNSLKGYIPYTIADVTEQEPPRLLASYPQPTTEVLESAGYGFATWQNGTDCRHIDWGSFPFEVHIDPTGTSDISDDDELAAIPPAFYTWENPPYYTINFVEGTQDNLEDIWLSYSINDGINSIGWVPNFVGEYSTAVALTWHDTSSHHVIEGDIALNDNKIWSLDAEASQNPNDYDVQSIATHEVGHVLGLGDLWSGSFADQTMGHGGAHDNSLRTLEWGDLNGAHYLYPEHDDAGSGADAGDTIGEATYVQRNQMYEGRLCDLPNEYPSDCFTFYAPSTMNIRITLYPSWDADFDLELYYPDGSLADYSRTEELGWSEQIIRYSIGGYGGFWTIRIYNHSNIHEWSNGPYEFYIEDFGAKYVSEIEYAGWLIGYGDASNGDGEKGPSPDNNYANIYGYQYGDAACIMAYTGQVASGGHHISMLAWSECGYNGEISVYVSENNYYDWVWVSNVVPDEAWTIVDLGYTTQQFQYVGIAFYIYYGEATVHIDCVNITP